MNKGQRQIIAEKIASTVRVLELLGFDHEVAGPKRPKAKGNKSPRVVTIKINDRPVPRVYNGVSGHTWANWANGDQALGIGSIEDLHLHLFSPKFAEQVAARDRVKKRGA